MVSVAGLRSQVWPRRDARSVKNFIMAPFCVEILDFQFLHIFPRYFNNCAIGFFVCKCALVSFYTYFPRILTILQISLIFQNPPQTPQGPPRDPENGPVGAGKKKKNLPTPTRPPRAPGTPQGPRDPPRAPGTPPGPQGPPAYGEAPRGPHLTSI